MKYAEKLIIERRSRIRSRKVDHTKSTIGMPELTYEKKNNFVESSIENTMLFFKAQSKLAWCAAGDGIDNIRQKVMKNEAKLTRRDRRN